MNAYPFHERDKVGSGTFMMKVWLWWYLYCGVGHARRRIVVDEEEWLLPNNRSRRLMKTRRSPSGRRSASTSNKFYAATPSMESHRVVSLRMPSDWSGRHYAGMLDSDESAGGRLFYWFFEKETRSSQTENVPLIIWLNGGPGCTSMDGLFLENGPLAMGERGSLVRRRSSWHRVGHVLYVDQPAGTGFSWSSRALFCHDDACICRHFSLFLKRFAKIYSSLVMATSRRSVPIYFSGESHAGHYIPLLTAALLEEKSSIQWDVRGMALGNAWIDPYNQYDASRVGNALGLVSSTEALKSLKVKEKNCQLALDRKQYMTKTCWDLLDDVVRFSGSTNRDRLRANMYDARESVRSTSAFPPGHERVEAFMNAPETRMALHVDPGSPTFRECANPPYNALKHQDGLGVMPTLKKLLEMRNVRILFYNGQFDLICNHVGVQRSLLGLDFRDKDDFRSASYSPWFRHADATRPAGHLLEGSSSSNLALLLVADSGHMVPMNQPDVALDMISLFIQATETHRPLAAIFADHYIGNTTASGGTCSSFKSSLR